MSVLLKVQRMALEDLRTLVPDLGDRAKASSDASVLVEDGWEVRERWSFGAVYESF